MLYVVTVRDLDSGKLIGNKSLEASGKRIALKRFLRNSIPRHSKMLIRVMNEETKMFSDYMVKFSSYDNKYHYDVVNGGPQCRRM